MDNQEPEWEGTRPAEPRTGFVSRHAHLWSPSHSLKEATLATSARPIGFRQRFDNLLPADRKYVGRSRRTFLFILLGLFICLLALILGLGIGLGLKKSSSAALPLPSNTATFTGDLTYYAPGLGSCGVTSASTDMICAVSMIIYDAASTSGNPNENPLCGKKIRVTRYDQQSGGNHSIDVTVVDRCVGCAAVDLDLSPTAFDKLADEALGRVTGSWAWLN